MTRGLYIHIPFCNSICTYCDFYKMIAKDDKKKKYIDYLIKEIEIKKNELVDIDTIFIGGGTPTSLSDELLSKLINTLFKFIDKDSIKEFSIESNPKDLTINKVKLLKELGVNRVSIGVQSFNEEKLKLLGRNHNKIDVLNAISNLKKVGINNINIDLIYGTSYDNEGFIKNELDQFYSLDIPHLSFYSLILEEKTILYNRYFNDEISLLDEDEESKIYNFLVHDLEKHGYLRYEISNFSKDGFNSLHNLHYWHEDEYASIGAGASAFIFSHRRKTISNLNKYFNGLDEGKVILEEDEEISEDEKMKETFILGLRLTEGISISNFYSRYNIDPLAKFKEEIVKLVCLDLIEVRDNHIRMKKDKFFLSNLAMMEFV